MHVILHVLKTKDNKQCVGYYRFQIEKRTNSACDITRNKNKRQQTVRVILHVTNRKDNKQCVGYYRLQIEKRTNSVCDATRNK